MESSSIWVYIYLVFISSTRLPLVAFICLWISSLKQCFPEAICVPGSKSWIKKTTVVLRSNKSASNSPQFQSMVASSHQHPLIIPIVHAWHDKWIRFVLCFSIQVANLLFKLLTIPLPLSSSRHSISLLDWKANYISL